MSAFSTTRWVEGEKRREALFPRARTPGVLATVMAALVNAFPAPGSTSFRREGTRRGPGPLSLASAAEDLSPHPCTPGS